MAIVGLPLPSGFDYQAQMFPTLTSAQIDRIRPWAKLRSVQSGEILFQPGDEHVPFFVLLSGNLEIVQPSAPQQTTIVTHQPGGFAGEITTMSGQRAFVIGRVANSGEFLEVRHEDFRTLIARDAELSEVFLKAFILRRVALIQGQLGNVIILGVAPLCGNAEAAGVPGAQRLPVYVSRCGNGRAVDRSCSNIST